MLFLPEIEKVKGYILQSNKNMYALAKHLGLNIETYKEDPRLYEVTGRLL